MAERKNRHILETARALLIGMNVPSHHWDDTVVTAVHLLNRMPSKVLQFKTPLQILSTHFSLPSILLIPPRIFGCVAFVHLHKNQRTKLDPCAVRCIFLGYATNKKGYRCYNPATKRTFVTMDVTFLESENYYSSPVLPSCLQGETWDEDQKWWDCPRLEEVQETDQKSAELKSGEEIRSGNEAITVEDNKEVSEINEERSNKYDDDVVEDNESIERTPLPLVHDSASLENIHEVSSLEPSKNHVLDIPIGYHLPFRHNRGKPPVRYSPNAEIKGSKYPIANHVSTKRLSEPLKAFIHKLSSCHIPCGVDEALTDPKWSQAIQEEMKALQKNKTWDLVSLPKGKRTVGCKWVFFIKHNADGSIERYKARLVAKGCTQTYGIDYQETFSPVAKLNTIRVLLSLVANLDWPLHQFDVKNAFLHGDLKEEVYMDIPPGYTTSSSTKVVCKLQRALYGLKQSPRAWFGRFSLAMKKYGFQQSNSDHTLFLKRQQGKVTALIIYVDDMIITGDDKEEILKLSEAARCRI